MLGKVFRMTWWRDIVAQVVVRDVINVGGESFSVLL